VLSLIGNVALAAGIGFGLLTAATGGLDFFAGWLMQPMSLSGCSY
jgi:hypothetical protein